MMRLRDVADWSRANRWWLAFCIVIFLGYSMGKDMALRDNRAAAIQAEMG